jgi:hypothetical protein
MKRVLFIVLTAVFLLAFIGCEKEDENKEIKKTSYQVSNKSEQITTPLDEYFDGSLWEVVVYCYIGDDIVRQDNFERVVPGGKSEIKEVPDDFEKIKVSFKMAPKQSKFYDSSANARLYTVSYTLLSKGANTIAELDGQTMVSKTLKSSSSQYEEKNEWESIGVLLKSFQD